MIEALSRREARNQKKYAKRKMSLVADPAQEAVEKFGRDFLKALDRIPSDEDAVPRSKATSAELF